MAAYVSPEHIRFETDAFLARLESEVGPYAARRAAELAVADYLEREVWPIASTGDNIGRIIDRLRSCRQHAAGAYVRDQDPDTGEMVGDARFALLWDERCGQRRLCPDEARLVAAQHADMIIPPLLRWVRGGKWRRVFFAVFTAPDPALGGLADGMSFEWRRANGIWRKTKRRGHHNTLDNVRGSVMTQEVHWTARGRWHPHINALMCVEGRFDWTDLRSTWGMNVDVQLVDTGSTGALADALKELFKYVCAVAGSKHHDPQGDLFNGDTSREAPPMIEWPPEAWLEWWRALHGRRLTRSTGVLFKLGKPEKAEPPPRIMWIVGDATYDRAAGRYRVQVRSADLVDLILQSKSTKSGTGSRPPPARAGPGPPSVSTA